MRIRIFKVDGLHTNKETLSIFCQGDDVKVDEINLHRKATLYLGEEKLSCVISSASKKKGGSCALSLKVVDTIANHNIVHPYHHKDNLNLTLLVHDNVSADLKEEARRLLDFVSGKSGRTTGDILYDVTSFRNVPGKRDLNLVSAKQLPIVVDKLTEISQSWKETT